EPLPQGRLLRRDLERRRFLDVPAGRVHVPRTRQAARFRRRRSAYAGAQALEGAHRGAALLREDDPAALAADVGEVMKLTSTAFGDGGRIPGALALCVIDAATHVRFSENMNPDLRWSDLPAGTRSLALICHDPDVPSRGDDVNKEGRTVPAALPRVDFFHW